MKIFAFSGILLSVASLLTGIFVIVQNHTKKIIRLYASFCALCAIIGISLYNINSNPENKIYSHLILISIITSNSLLLHFIIELANHSAKKIIKISYGLNMLLAVIVVIDFIINTKIIIDKQIPTFKFNYDFLSGNIGLVIFWLFIIVSVSIAVFLLFKLSKQKNENIHHIIPALILWLIGLSGIIIQIDFFNLSAIISLLSSVAIMTIGYIIIKYHTSDPSYVIRQSIVYTILSLTAFIFYVAITTAQQNITIFKTSTINNVLLIFFAGLIISIIIKFFYDYLINFINQIFQKTSYNYQKILNETSQAISASIEYNKIISIINDFTGRTMGVKKNILVRYDQNSYNFFEISNNKQPWVLTINHPLIKLLKKIKTIVMIEDVQSWQESQTVLNQLYIANISSKDLISINNDFFTKQIVGAIPLISKQKLTGFLGIGKKISEETYSAQEVEMLNTLANQIAISLENIALYQNVKKTEQDIREERDKTQSAITHLTDGLIVTDLNFNISLINPTAEKMFPDQQLNGQPLPEILRHQINESAEPINYPIVSEITIEKPKKIILRITTTEYLNQNNGLIGYVKHLHDITREKEIDKIKSDFIRTAAHKLRTPLSATKWILKMLSDGDVGEITNEQKQFLEKGYQSNERMISVVNKLLSVSEIEEGKFSFYFKEIQLADMINEVIQEMKPLADEKEQRIIYSQDKYIAKVNADQSKLKVVIQSLLLNSIMYTPKGGQIDIKLENLKKEIKFTITDNGVGIPDYQQNKLFTKFMRGDNILKQETEGNGLDLYIAKNIIQAHKGQIDFIDPGKQGSTFYFTIPITRD